MITQSLVRATRTICSSIPSRTATFAANGQTCQFAVCTSRAHQRRLSSSKASVPPNGTQKMRASAPSQQKTTSTSTRVRGRKAKAPIVESGYVHLPSVPSTQHLPEADIQVASFFSLHRPISLTPTTVFPPATSLDSFSTLFENRPHQPGAVLSALGSGVNHLESTNSQEMQLEQAFAAQNIAGVPRDIPFVGLRPFAPPPVPGEYSESPKASKRSRNLDPFGRSKQVINSESGKERAWMTTITVTERTTPTGKRVYSAESTPLEQIEQMEPAMSVERVGIEEPTDKVTRIPLRQPFLQKMRIRQMEREERRREQLIAISVKRQRKMKMKKHKYKKLMKRTRNQRRKLGRL